MGRSGTIKRGFKEHPVKIGLASLCILLFVAFHLWNSYAPLHIHNWNKRELSRIKVVHNEGFTFAVFGDNKGNRSIFNSLLHDTDKSREIAFAIDLGDLVKQSKRGLYRLFLRQVQRNLKIPLVTAAGNHDFSNLSGNYQRIFGPTYYAFQIAQCYFIVLDTTTEFGFDKAERQWLEEQLKKAQSAKARFIFMHVPLFDPRGDGFNKGLPERDGKDLLDLFKRYKVTHLFASHIHGYFSGTWEGLPYTITGGAGAALQGIDPQHFFHHYVKVHVHHGRLVMVIKRIEGENGILRFIEIIEDDLLEWVLLLGAGISLLTFGLSMKGRENL